MSPRFTADLEQKFTPAYLKLLESGELEARVAWAKQHSLERLNSRTNPFIF